jgi:hypothetical protein
MRDVREGEAMSGARKDGAVSTDAPTESKCMTGCGRLALWCGPCTEVNEDKAFDAVAGDIAQWLRDSYDEEGVLAIAERIEAGEWRR